MCIPLPGVFIFKWVNIPDSNTSLILEAWLKEGLRIIYFICKPQFKVWSVRTEKCHKENPSKKGQRTHA